MEHERARCWHQSTQNHTIINIHVLLNLQFLNNKHFFATPNIQRAFFLSRLLTSYVLGVLAPCGRHF